MADPRPAVAPPVVTVDRGHWRLTRMLEARSIAVVGASERPGSFGLRLATEALRSPARPAVHLIHPRRSRVLGRPCLPSLADIPEAVDLVLLGVPDGELVDQVALATQRGDGGAVVFGSAVGLGDDLRRAAAGLPICGAGCMGFVNVARGVRAIGYLERDPLPAGGIAVVSHSGSVFSALLRTRRRLEYAFVVSSGQELVTTTADYLRYALDLPETRVVGLFLETLRDVPGLRAELARAANLGVPVVALTVGGSNAGRRLVEAHSGALAGADAAWEALFASYGVHRAQDLDELVNTLEAFSIGRRVRPGAARGLASVHDSGAERVLVADVAEHEGVPFATLGESTRQRLHTVLGPGLDATNPLDVWSTGADTAGLVTSCLTALADDPEVALVALAVDLVPEYDGDEAYPEAVEATLDRTDKPVVVVANLASAVDQDTAARLRFRGVPVLEGTTSALRTVAHLLAESAGPPVQPASPKVDADRQERWRRVLAKGRPDQATALALVADYGLSVALPHPVDSAEEAVAAARQLGLPVVLKTDDPAVSHKVDAGGVMLGLDDDDAIRAAYRKLTDRLGPRVVVQRQLDEGVELCLGVLTDPLVGAMVIVAVGGTLTESMGQRRVRLPPMETDGAEQLLAQPAVARLLQSAEQSSGPRSRTKVIDAVLAMTQLAVELGESIEAIDVNPVIVGRGGVVAVDALVLPSAAR